MPGNAFIIGIGLGLYYRPIEFYLLPLGVINDDSHNAEFAI